ncbi:MAG: glycosyltransferase family A protein [Pseudomonadota bacterium]
MKASPFKYRIGIPTYKRPDDLENCLNALVPQLRGRENVKLVVVNDASHDEEYERVLAPFDKLIEYRVQSVNSGPGLARSAAFADAVEDFLICLDDDCIPPKNWFETVQAIVEANPEVDLIAGYVDPVWTDKPGFWDRLVAAPMTYPGPAISEQGLITAVTANALYRREAYENAGGFDPNITGATEDCCMTQRIINSGGCYLICESWRMGHKARQTLGKIRRTYYGYGYGGAQAVLEAKVWKLAEISSCGTLIDSCKTVIKRIDYIRRTEGAEDKPVYMKFVHGLVTLIAFVEYERGWLKGLRAYGYKDENSIPKRAGLLDRFAIDLRNHRV